MSKVVSSVDNLLVLYEDNHLIIVNKRSGDIVQGDKTGDVPLSEIVKIFLKKKYNKPGAVFLGVTHRLDRPTSGAIIFTKTSKALSRMNRLFLENKVHKTYWAITDKKEISTSGTLTNWLRKNPKNNTSKAYAKAIPNSKKAVLHYQLKYTLERYQLLEIHLETGRHHQIRSQLAAIGYPIKGDLKYGYDRSNRNGGIHLHARSLSFTHPVSQLQINLQAPPPADPIWDVCSNL